MVNNTTYSRGCETDSFIIESPITVVMAGFLHCRESRRINISHCPILWIKPDSFLEIDLASRVEYCIALLVNVDHEWLQSCSNVVSCQLKLFITRGPHMFFSYPFCECVRFWAPSLYANHIIRAPQTSLSTSFSLPKPHCQGHGPEMHCDQNPWPSPTWVVMHLTVTRTHGLVNLQWVLITPSQTMSPWVALTWELSFLHYLGLEFCGPSYQKNLNPKALLQWFW